MTGDSKLIALLLFGAGTVILLRKPAKAAEQIAPNEVYHPTGANDQVTTGLWNPTSGPAQSASCPDKSMAELYSNVRYQQLASELFNVLHYNDLEHHDTFDSVFGQLTGPCDYQNLANAYYYAYGYTVDERIAAVHNDNGMFAYQLNDRFASNGVYIDPMVTET